MSGTPSRAVERAGPPSLAVRFLSLRVRNVLQPGRKLKPPIQPSRSDNRYKILNKWTAPTVQTGKACPPCSEQGCPECGRGGRTPVWDMGLKGEDEIVG